MNDATPTQIASAKLVDIYSFQADVSRLEISPTDSPYL